MLEGLVKVPEDAAKGSARVALSFDAWSNGRVTPATLEIAIAEIPVKVSEHLRATLLGHTRGVGRVRFSPDGTVLASNDGSEVKFWNVSGQTEWFTLAHGFAQVFGSAFTPDGRCFAAVGRPTPSKAAGAPIPGTELRIWDLTTRRQVAAIRAAAPREVFNFAFARDGKEVAVRESWKDGKTEHSMQFQIVVRNLATGSARLTLPVEDDTGPLLVSPDGKILANGADVVRLIDLDTGRGLHTLKPVGRGDVHCMEFSSDGRMLVAADLTGTVTVWDTASWKVKRRLDHGDKESVWGFTLSPDGRKLATATSDQIRLSLPQGVAVWDMTTGNRHWSFSGHKAGVASVAFSPDGKTLASGGDDNAIILWDP